MIGHYAVGRVAVSAIRGAESAIAGEALFALSTAPYVTLPSDAPASVYYDPRLGNPLFMSRSVRRGGFVAAGTSAATARMEIRNADGYLDGLGTAYSVSGRRVRVLAVQPGAPYRSAELVIDGAALTTSFNNQAIAISLRTKDSLLDEPVQPATFTGEGGAEGGTDLASKPKPIALGEVYGVAPPYLGIVEGRHSYHVGENISDVIAFYDRGVRVTKVAGTPSVGEWSVNTATGILQHGGAPTGLITADIQGYAPGGVYDPTIAGILRSLLVDFAGLDELDVVAFDRLATETRGRTAGLWIGAEATATRAAVDRVLSASTAYGGFNRQGRFAPKILRPPSGAILARFDRTNIVSLERLEPPDVINPPTHRVRVGWRRNHSVFKDAPAGATEAQRAFMAAEYREVMVQDQSVKLKHRGSKPVFLGSLFVSEDDARAEAERLLALYSVDRNIWRVESRGVSPLLDIGDTVELSYPRFRLSKKLGTVIAIEVDLSEGETVMEIFA